MKYKLAALCLIVAGSSALAQPNAELVKGSIEFGYIPSASVVSHTAWIKSTGTDTLVVKRIVTGCVCATTDSIDNTSVAPGDSLELDFIWSLKNRVGGSGVYPRIYTNARPEPFFVHMTGMPTKDASKLDPVHFGPFRLAFAKTPSKSIDSISVEVTNSSDEGIGLELVSSPPRQVDYFFPDSLRAGETATGWVRVRAAFLDQEFHGSFTFKLSDKQEKPVTLPFHRKFFLPDQQSSSGD